MRAQSDGVKNGILKRAMMGERVMAAMSSCSLLALMSRNAMTLSRNLPNR
jgi:hypothetical protein